MKQRQLYTMMIIGLSVLFVGCAHNDEMRNPTIDPPVDEDKLQYWEDRYVGDDKDQQNQAISISGHEAIDLGLPSGTLWATRNVGAEGPEYIGTLLDCDSITFDWGGTWRLPTREDAQELFDHCVFRFENGYYYTTDWYIPICKVIGPNGNYILLPPTTTVLYYGGADVTGVYWLDSIDETENSGREVLFYGLYTYGIITAYSDGAIRLVCDK